MKLCTMFQLLHLPWWMTYELEYKYNQKISFKCSKPASWGKNLSHMAVKFWKKKLLINDNVYNDYDYQSYLIWNYDTLLNHSYFLSQLIQWTFKTTYLTCKGSSNNKYFPDNILFCLHDRCHVLVILKFQKAPKIMRQI